MKMSKRERDELYTIYLNLSNSAYADKLEHTVHRLALFLMDVEVE